MSECCKRRHRLPRGMMDRPGRERPEARSGNRTWGCTTVGGLPGKEVRRLLLIGSPLAGTEVRDPIRVKLATGHVRIRGDRGVSRVSVRSPYLLRSAGQALIIERNKAQPRLRLSFLRGGSGHRRHKERMDLLVNPSIPLEVLMDSGTLHISGVHAPIEAHLGTGSVVVEQVVEPIQLSVRSGNIRIAGRFIQGNSHATADLGNVTVQLDPASDVRVRTSVVLGCSGPDTPQPLGPERHLSSELVIGSGTASLCAESRSGLVSVTLLGS